MKFGLAPTTSVIFIRESFGLSYSVIRLLGQAESSKVNSETRFGREQRALGRVHEKRGRFYFSFFLQNNRDNKTTPLLI